MSRVHDATRIYDPQRQPRILLDTCVLLWIASGYGDRLGKHARHALERHQWSVSAASLWEISIKYHQGHLPLVSQPMAWWDAVREHHQVTAIPFTGAMGLVAGGLPLHHRDPFDRAIVATAQQESLLLVSPDPEIARYRDVIGVIW